MSSPTKTRRITVPDIRRLKGQRPIVSLTSYHAHTASLVDPFVDFLLVGDSLGMVMHGMDSTLGVSLDLMIMHARAVVRGSERALVVVDLPFGTYEESPEYAFRNAARVMKETGCGAIKLEGGALMAETIAFLSARGIPVLAHIGLTPQSVNTMGGYRVQGHDQESQARLKQDALAVSEAGAFAVVLEGIVEPVAASLSALITIPTIGIGASASCDGQILVLEDMLGLNPNVAKFVKVFGDVGTAITKAAKAYAEAVSERAFPATEHTYQPKDLS